MTETRRQLAAQFGCTYETRLRTLAAAFGWGEAGPELHRWINCLLPDGYEGPADETHEELRTALDAWEDQLRQMIEDADSNAY